jgi:hypothetical protein
VSSTPPVPPSGRARSRNGVRGGSAPSPWSPRRPRSWPSSSPSSRWSPAARTSRPGRAAPYGRDRARRTPRLRRRPRRPPRAAGTGRATPRPRTTARAHRRPHVAGTSGGRARRRAGRAADTIRDHRTRALPRRRRTHRRRPRRPRRPRRRTRARRRPACPADRTIFIRLRATTLRPPSSEGCRAVSNVFHHSAVASAVTPMGRPGRGPVLCGVGSPRVAGGAQPAGPPRPARPRRAVPRHPQRVGAQKRPAALDRDKGHLVLI